MIQPPAIIKAWIDDVIENGRRLTDWEQHFIESLWEQFELRGRITDRQEEILDRIRSEKTV